MSQHIIRRARADDIASMARINAEVFLGDRDHLPGATAWVTSFHNAFPVYQYFVIEQAGVLAGYAGWQTHGGFHRSEPAIELDQIGIDPVHQGKGLASELIGANMKELATWMQTINDRIESHIGFVVWVNKHNKNATRVYTKMFGDMVCGRRTQFGDREEIMFRTRVPIIRPVRDESA
ncbi:GNAT family N-acetyltransferase [Candidatus Kaiserbacteria bacterium]|nr:GNAT family N-acetyltransferase [Candidatus Kaiserbacteria bacterium]